MIVRAVALALLATTPTHADTQKKATTSMTHHATSTFAVTITPETQGAAPAGGVATGRMALLKTFSGALTGTAHGAMLTAGIPTPGNAAYYVAIDQFEGMLDGRKGGFVLLHKGVMTKAGRGDLTVTIGEDSGTGALAGISGALTIRIEGGTHFYDLDYTLPDGAP